MGEVTKAMMAVVFISMLMYGSFLFIGSFSTNYAPTTAFSNSSAAFTTLNQTAIVSTMAENMTSNIQDQQSTGTDLADLLLLASTAATQTVLMMLAMPGIMISLFAGFVLLGAEIGLPLGWIAGSLALIAAIVFVMNVINNFISKKEM